MAIAEAEGEFMNIQCACISKRHDHGEQDCKRLAPSGESMCVECVEQYTQYSSARKDGK